MPRLLTRKTVVDADALAGLAWLTGPIGDKAIESTMFRSSLSRTQLLIACYRYLQSLEKEVQALRKQSSSASPACVYSNGDNQLGPVPADMPQPLVLNAVGLEQWLVGFQHTAQQDVDILPRKSPLMIRTVADQTLGAVHIPGELVLSLLEGYLRLRLFLCRTTSR